ncbi:MAG: hypothetical protein ACRCX2_07235 [Paraclostridium sp.]
MKEKFIELVTKVYDGEDNSMERLVEFTTDVITENIQLRERVRELELQIHNQNFHEGHITTKLEQLVCMTGITI